MDKESKGIAWFGNIYRKLETVLSEVDNFASQNRVRVSGENTISPKKPNDAQGLVIMRDEPKEVMENFSSRAVAMQQYHDDLSLPSCNDPSEPPSDENLEISKSIISDERVYGNGSDEKFSDTALLSDQETRLSIPWTEENIGNNNQRETTSFGPQEHTSLQDMNRRVSDDSQSNVSSEAQIACSSSESFRTEVPRNDYSIVYSSLRSSVGSNLVQVATEIPPVLVEENMAKMRPTGNNSVASIGDQYGSSNDEHDAATLEAIELYDMADGEDHLDIDDHMLYAVHYRTRKLRSFKKKITDALAPRKQREKEYEQLAIWFGDASMGSDLDTAKALPSKTVTAIDTKRPLESEDSDWELL